MRDRLDVWAMLLSVLLIAVSVPVLLAVWPSGPLARIGVALALLAIYAVVLGIGSVALLASEGRRNTQIGKIQQQERAAYQAHVIEYVQAVEGLYLHD